MSFEYNVEGRLSKAYQTNAPSQGGTYGYDAQDRLASRTVTGGATTLYVHDLDNHIIAETNAAGVTLREYLWLNDLPVAVVDGVNTASPTLYYVHTDHLGRPARMVAQNWAWEVIYAPFGGTAAIYDATTKLDMRFPGQWFQLESGLAYNWHRHYDATLGRYVQPDPMGFEGGKNLLAYVNLNPLTYFDFSGLLPDPNGAVPGGPWSSVPVGDSVPDGRWRSPKLPEGGRAECQWVPAYGEGGPVGSKGYWKTKTPQMKGWVRYDQNGRPITAAEAHEIPQANSGGGCGCTGGSNPISPILRFGTPTGVFFGTIFYSTPAY